MSTYKSEDSRHVSLSKGKSSEFEEIKIPIKQPGGSVGNACFNMIKCNLGTGIFSFSVAFLKAGFVSAIITTVVVGAGIYWTGDLLIILSEKYKKNTYEEIVEQCLGKVGRVVCTLVGFVFTLGALCSYAIIISDSIPPLLVNLTPWTETCIVEKTCNYGKITSLVLDRRVVMIFTMAFGVLQRCFKRELHLLTKYSMAGLFLVLFIISSVIAKSVLSKEHKGTLEGSSLYSVVNLSGVGYAISSATFSNTVQHSQFSIFRSLRNNTKTNKRIVLSITMVISTALILIYGIPTYINLNNKLEGNALNSFPSTDILTSICRLAFVANIVITYPLAHYTCKDYVLNAMFQGTRNTGKITYTLVTLVLFAIPILVAMFLCKFETIIQATGGFSASIMVFFLPQACWIAAKRREGGKWNWRMILTASTISLSILLIILTITDLATNLFSLKEEKCKYLLL